MRIHSDNYWCHPRLNRQAIWYLFRLITLTVLTLPPLGDIWLIPPRVSQLFSNFPSPSPHPLPCYHPHGSHHPRHPHRSCCPLHPDQSFPELSRTPEGVIETHKNTFNAKMNGNARERKLCVGCERRQMYQTRNGEEKNRRTDKK